jgi:hypothetical protein
MRIHDQAPARAAERAESPQKAPSPDDVTSALSLVDLSDDVIANMVRLLAMSARTADNPAKQIREWMSAFCAVRKGFCPGDWYRLALAAFGYECTPPPAPTAVFLDSESNTAYSEVRGQETPPPATPALPLKGFETWKALFDGACSLFIDGLGSALLDPIKRAIGSTQHLSAHLRSVDYILPMFEPPGVDTLAKQLSDPSMSQRTLDTLYGDMNDVKKVCVHRNLFRDENAAPLIAVQTLLEMRGATDRLPNYYYRIDNELAAIFKKDYELWTSDGEFVKMSNLLQRGANPNTHRLLTWLVRQWLSSMAAALQVPKIINLFLDNWHADMPVARRINQSDITAREQGVFDAHFSLLWAMTRQAAFRSDMHLADGSEDDNKKLVERWVGMLNGQDEDDNKLIVRLVGMLVPWTASFISIIPVPSFVCALSRYERALHKSDLPAWIHEKWSEVLEEGKKCKLVYEPPERYFEVKTALPAGFRSLSKTALEALEKKTLMEYVYNDYILSPPVLLFKSNWAEWAELCELLYGPEFNPCVQQSKYF